jgi:hypothetical protein
MPEYICNFESECDGYCPHHFPHDSEITRTGELCNELPFYCSVAKSEVICVSVHSYPEGE